MNKPTYTYRKHSLFPKTLKETVDKITPALCAKRGNIMPALLRHWPEIVGQPYAKYSVPLNFYQDPHTGLGLLTLKAPPAVALEMTHMEPQILERIARFLGYRAVQRLKITH